MTHEDRQLDEDAFWDALGDHALDRSRVLMLEALWRVEEPLSAIDLVDVLDGHLTMWEAQDYLEALGKLDVVEPTSTTRSGGQRSDFDAPYRLKTAASSAN